MDIAGYLPLDLQEAALSAWFSESGEIHIPFESVPRHIAKQEGSALRLGFSCSIQGSLLASYFKVVGSLFVWVNPMGNE